MKKIMIVSGEDWEGLYIDDKLVLQNHVLGLHEVLRSLDIVLSMADVNQEWLEERAHFPENFNDIPKDKLS